MRPNRASPRIERKQAQSASRRPTNELPGPKWKIRIHWGIIIATVLSLILWFVISVLAHLSL